MPRAAAARVCARLPGSLIKQLPGLGAKAGCGLWAVGRPEEKPGSQGQSRSLFLRSEASWRGGRASELARSVTFCHRVWVLGMHPE